MSNEKRAAVYGVATAVLAAMAAFGWINADQQEMLFVAIGSTLTALSQLMSTIKTWNQRGTAATTTIHVENSEQLAAELKKLDWRGLA